MKRTRPTRLSVNDRITGSQQGIRDVGLQQEFFIVDSRWVGAPGANGSYPPPTGDPSQNYATTKFGNSAGLVFPAQPLLTSALASGTAYTTLSITPLGAPVFTDQAVVLVSGGSGGSTQAWTVSANAAVGATSLSVLSQNANANYPVNTIVSGAAAPPSIGIAMWRQQQVLTGQITAGGGALTSLPCSAFLPVTQTGPATGVIAPAGAKVTVIARGAAPVTYQQWTLTSAVTAGAGTTSLAVASQTPSGTFPNGSLIGIWLPV